MRETATDKAKGEDAETSRGTEVQAVLGRGRRMAHMAGGVRQERRRRGRQRVP